ncbi:MAG: hypothetical protein M3Y32_10030 [Pseudomonadota bacterium]|nr:hypothetical protein [Pseudomonadota bacterium]
MELPAIHSRADFSTALLWGFAAAIAEGARRIVCADPDFEQWPLDDLQLIERLTAWLRLPQRRLVLLAADFEILPRRCPRFNTWRHDWVHAVEALQPPAELRAGLPSVLWSDRGISVQLIDKVHGRGRASDDGRHAQQWRDQLDAFLQRSEPAFAPRVLGL